MTVRVAEPLPDEAHAIVVDETEAGPRLHTVSGRRGLGLGLTLTTVALWSVLPMGLRIALGGLDAATLTWSRFLCAALFMGTVLTAQGTLPALRRFTRRDWSLVAVAIVFLCANYLLYVLGLERTNAGTAQVVIQLAPLLLAVGGVWVYGERLGLPQWLGFATMATGFVLFSYEQISHMVGALDRYLAGVGWIAFAAVTWAIYGLAQKQLLRWMSSQGVMLCIYAGCALLFLPASRPAAIGAVPAAAWPVLLFCAANTLVAYGAFAAALEHWEASRVSAVLALTPLATLAFASAAAALFPARFATEPLSAASWLGAGIVVAGSLATALGRGQRATRSLPPSSSSVGQ